MDALAEANERAYLHPALSPASRLVLAEAAAQTSAGDSEVLTEERLLVALQRVNVFVGYSAPEGAPAAARSGMRLAEVVADPPSEVEPRRAHRDAGPYLDPAVARWVAGATPPSEDPLFVATLRRTDWDISVSADHAILLDALAGRVRTEGDALRARGRFADERRAAGVQALLPVADAIEAIGGAVVDVDGFGGAVYFRASARSLQALLQQVDLGSLELVPTPQDDNPGIGIQVYGPDLHGRELADLIQSEPYYARGYLGGGNGGFIAFREPAGAQVFRDHPGFRSGSGLWRFVNCGYVSGGCNYTSPSVGGAHSTAGASILIGDITAGQDPQVTGALARRARSGVAREAWAVGFDSSSPASWLSARMTAPLFGVRVASLASSYYTNDDPDQETCTGTTARDKQWNALFEAGIGVFKSAGNEDHPTLTDCRIGQPGSAIGVFTVGAHYVSELGAAQVEVLYSRQSNGGWAVGGYSAEGRGRTLVDISAPSNHTYAYPHFDRPSDPTTSPPTTWFYGTQWADLVADGDYGPHFFNATSGATPVAAGAAALFRDWFRSTQGNYIDHPGVLYANMLLMGDRTYYTGGRMQAAFDHRWGAGKLRLRTFDDAGLDNPADWETGEVCVPHGASVYLPLGSPSLDVDVVRAVIWTYDRRHEDGVTHDDIDLYLQRESSPGSWQTLRSDLGTDNKKRVFYEAPGGAPLRLRVRGTNVTTTLEGCGNAMKVYYAWFWEDSDRETAEGLGLVRVEN